MNKTVFIPLLMIIAGCTTAPAETPLDPVLKSLQGVWYNDGEKVKLTFNKETLSIVHNDAPQACSYLGIHTLKDGKRAAVYKTEVEFQAYYAEGSTLRGAADTPLADLLTNKASVSYPEFVKQ